MPVPCIVAACGSGQNAASSPLLDGLIEYFSLNIASGGLTGLHSGITLTNAGDVSSGTGHVYASSGDFPELATAQLYTDAAALKNLTAERQDFEIAFWMYVRSLYVTKPPYRGVIANSSFRKGFSIKIADNNAIAFTVADQLTNSFAVVHASLLALSQWQLTHFLFRYRDNGGTDEGKLEAGVNGTLTAATAWIAGLTQAASNDLNFGANGADLPDMLLGPALFYDRVLTSDERTQLYNGGAGLKYAEL
jgi:hypothetical protein